MEKIDLREKVDEVVNRNISQNAVYDDFLIDGLMVILKREIIKENIIDIENQGKV